MDKAIMINVFLNAEAMLLDDSTNLSAFVEQYGGDEPFAVAVNEMFIPKYEYEEILIKEGDRIDIVAPMQGG